MEIHFEIPKSKSNKLGVIISVEVKFSIILVDASSREMGSLLPPKKKLTNF
jgi:hypothetical protein